jgi:predicted RND superfamily exporter protein
MKGKRALTGLIDGAAVRPRRTVAIVAVLALVGGLLALGLRPSTGIGTLVSPGSADSRATAVDAHRFGGDAVVVLVREPLADLLETSDLDTVSRLEACLAGEQLQSDGKLHAFAPVPASRARPYGGAAGPCGGLMRLRPAKVVYGPGTFLSRAVAAVNSQIALLGAAARTAIADAEHTALELARRRGLSPAQARAASSAAGALEAQSQAEQLAGLATGSGLGTTPAINNPAFIERIVFGGLGSSVPKARLHYLFPSPSAALIQVRLRAGLSASQQADAIARIRRAVAMPTFRLGHGGSYVVSGEPVVLDDLAGTITRSIAILLIGAVIVMAAALMLVFRGTMRLLPLALALAAAAITFGLTATAGATLTIASIAVLPVLIGLAVDYAIQFQSRVRQAEVSGAAEAVHAAGVRGAGTIVAAGAATAAGFLVLLLSPVPMVRGFGLLLVVGVAIALVLTLTAGPAALVLADRTARRSSRSRWRPATPEIVGASLRGAGELLGDAAGLVVRKRRPELGSALAALTRRPALVLALGLALAVGGWVAATQVAVQSDITKLVPPSMPALRHLRTLERVTGSSGEIDVVVHARDVATPRALRWMVGYEQQVLSHFGYSEARGCADASLCPALSLPDLFAGGAGGGGSGAASLSSGSIDSLLASVPRYFSQAVITPDRRYAVLTFGIRLMPLAKQQRVVAYMRAHLRPAAGVSARLAGLPVLAADAGGALASNGRRLLMLVAGLVAVLVVLLAIFRRPRRAIVPLVPIALATGWSSLIVAAVGIPLNPMSATLGTLVIAISTEFSVLLSERVGEERRDGESLAVALERAYRSTGSAVLASGVTVVAGFAVLMLSNITMLREFGAVTVIDLSVSLAGVLVVLPAALAAADRGWRRAPVGGLAPPRVRRRAPVA